MSLVTLFSAPKPFTDPRIRVIQSNAILSWTLLEDSDVFLLGDDDGVAEAARDFGVGHLRDVARNEMGTPLVSSMVQLARQHSSSALLCIINADMIVMNDLIQAARQVMALVDRFVLLGRRWDLEIASSMDFADGWEVALRAAVERRGTLHRPAGSDFFIFPRSCYENLPDFAVGRAGWDNWMICEARRKQWPVIDGTPSITVVHQNHDYAHLPGSQPHYAMPESDENIRLAGGQGSTRYTVLDATHCLNEGKLVHPPLSYQRLGRGLEVFLRAALAFLPARTIEELVRPRRWKMRILRILGKQ